MKSLKEQFIDQLIEEVVYRVGESHSVRVMDLGCGTAAYMPDILKKYPALEYVGVEPNTSSYEAAEKNLEEFDKAQLHFKLGYDSVPDETEGSFDLVFSLSVLEHIKHLDRFIAMSAKYLKTGGTLMHRYDLGHALYPNSLKERVHVFLGNNLPQVLPERKFVRYVPETEVRELFQQNDVKPTRSTYHQMPNHKALEKVVKETDATSISELFDWETKHQGVFASLEVKQRELLFPAVAVFGIKE